MKWTNFSKNVPGKWVLVGEHAVLRGVTAVAIPEQSVSLSLHFDSRKSASSLNYDPPEASSYVGELIESVKEYVESSGRVFEMPTGNLKIESTIPVGAGLGSSAALCVAMTHWMQRPLGLKEDQILEFATKLEHRFHGRSSGMDVAVIEALEPIAFEAKRGLRKLGIRQLPKFTLHDTKIRTRTSECISRVEQIREEDPELAFRIDDQMAQASRKALEGLVRYDQDQKNEGYQLIVDAMGLARECFYQWQLVPGEARRLEEELLGQGASAVKLTGAGGGGMVVALWPN